MNRFDRPRLHTAKPDRGARLQPAREFEISPVGDASAAEGARHGKHCCDQQTGGDQYEQSNPYLLATRFHAFSP